MNAEDMVVGVSLLKDSISGRSPWESDLQQQKAEPWFPVAGKGGNEKAVCPRPGTPFQLHKATKAWYAYS